MFLQGASIGLLVNLELRYVNPGIRISNGVRRLLDERRPGKLLVFGLCAMAFMSVPLEAAAAENALGPRG